MKNLLLVPLLACFTVITFAQKSKKFQRAQTKIEDQKKAEEKTEEEYSYWTDTPDDHDGYHKGYVIDAMGYKIEGIVKYKGAFEIVRVIEPSGKTTLYNAGECMEFGYDAYRFVSTGTTFMEVIYDLKSICVYQKTGSIGMTMTMPNGAGGYMAVGTGDERDGIQYYIRKKNEKEFEAVREINFCKKFSKYFADCPYLYENIKAKQFQTTKDDITAIAAIYDRECAPANK